MTKQMQKNWKNRVLHGAYLSTHHSKGPSCQGVELGEMAQPGVRMPP